MESDNMKPPPRIVTRPDFDGVVCAALLAAAENIDRPPLWVSPSDMQKGRIAVQEGDIIANLPYHENCRLWFDHHYSNQIRGVFPGLFRIAPSAAGLVFEYYRPRFERDYTTLVQETDKIDSAALSMDEILYPERFPYVCLSMTIHSQAPEEAPYWNHLAALLRDCDIDAVMRDEHVQRHVRTVGEENRRYRRLLEKHTELKQHVAVTDFRPLGRMPDGNRFLVYSMYPKAIVHVKIGFVDPDRQTVAVKVGHSILNRNCRINVGKMLSFFEGGGHRGAGAARFQAESAADYLPRIIDILLENNPEDSIVNKTNRRPDDRRSGKDRRRGSSPDYFADGGVERRRRPDRRSGPTEPRKGWRRTGRWKSVPIFSESVDRR